MFNLTHNDYFYISRAIVILILYPYLMLVLGKHIVRMFGLKSFTLPKFNFIKFGEFSDTANKMLKEDASRKVVFDSDIDRILRGEHD